MGVATYEGRGFKERTGVSGERPTGTANFRQQSIQASFESPPPPPPVRWLNKVSLPRFSLRLRLPHLIQAVPPLPPAPGLVLGGPVN